MEDMFRHISLYSPFKYVKDVYEYYESSNKYIITDKIKEICFDSACRNGKIELVNYMIEKGVDIHSTYEYGLITAICHGHYNIVKLLVASGANIYTSGDLPLKKAIWSKEYEIAKLLFSLYDVPCDFEEYNEIKRIINDEKDVFINVFIVSLNYHEINKDPIFDMNPFIFGVGGYLFYK